MSEPLGFPGTCPGIVTRGTRLGTNRATQRAGLASARDKSLLTLPLASIIDNTLCALHDPGTVHIVCSHYFPDFPVFRVLLMRAVRPVSHPTL